MAGTSKVSQSKRILETIREATGASDEDIQMVLKECNNDVNEATARLIDSTCLPFETIL
jgi:NACalpha-BTF3-like transcription factor